MKIPDRPMPGDRYRASRADAGPIGRIDAESFDQTPPKDTAFTRAVSESRSRQTEQPALADRLDALAQPAASDSRSYENARSIELLQHVVDSILPKLEADDDIVAMARDIIGEELEWRQAWEGRMNEAMAPSLDDDPGEKSLS
ncbi:hypothetical protein [Salinicola sp. MH3R3-1]|uniref:hypothetical protein n=1 Tax=Salinicola sp. MH3R3-1 TaxID=1928762 RepID=UPI000B05E33C|nr:hypothetical protein [Salinicola sp. MH3R3-1]